MDNLSHREELIEKYVSGEMSSEELRAFENEMDVNSELKEEVSFQKDIINALKMERSASLKARMDNVKIPSPYSPYLTAGVASVVIIGGIALLSTLWPLELHKELPEADQKIENTIKEESAKPEVTLVQPIKESEDSNLEPEPQEEIEVKVLSEKSESTSKSITKDSEIRSDNLIENRKPKIKTPEAPDPGSDSGFTTSGIESGSEELINNDKRETAKVEVEIKASKEYDFHYQYFNNKLFLYGDFSKSPYELIELNNDGTKKLYMYFSGKYYSMNSNQMEVSKLSPLRDKIIIRGLDNLRLR